MISLDNPFFVKVILKPRKNQKENTNVQGKMADVLKKLEDEKLDYLFVTGNITKIVPIWKIGSIINLTKEYTSKIKEESESLCLDDKALNFLENKNISLVVSFKEENDIEKDLYEYMKGNLDKNKMEVSTSDVKDLESMIKLYKATFDVESVELLKLD